MSGKFITTYISNIKNIEKEDFFADAIKLYVARGTKPMESLSKIGFVQILELAPSHELLNAYKIKDIDWEQYVMSFRQYMFQNPKTYKALRLIIKRLKEGKTVIVCCYEKNYKECHRYIESNLFFELGFECYEYNKK